MISKELLSAVLGISLQNIRYNDTTNLYKIFKEDLFNWGDGSYGRWSNLEVNIYELAHKCKEWAYSQGYILFSKIRLNSSLASCYFDTMGKHDYEDEYHNDFRAETESEAIFKACEWILTKDSK